MRLPNSEVGLALSGGGVRAIAFHSGVVRWLAEQEALETVRHVSSVSGGSLFTGLIIRLCGYRWPTSQQYLEQVLPNIRILLTEKSLQFDAALRLFANPLNWRYALSRANVLASSIEHLWSISATLDDLPGSPVWSINGTTAENGRRFRFKERRIGDYEIGYAAAGHFKLAEAMAVSAAFPFGIGPLRIRTTSYRWQKRPSWHVSSEKTIEPEFKSLHVYDGGVYDNLAMETFFDVGTQKIKAEHTVPIDFLIVADASAPFYRRPIPGPLHPWRMKRIADIGFDQARALRVRSFVSFLRSNPDFGMMVQAGSDPVSCIERYAKKEDSGAIKSTLEWLVPAKVDRAASYKTTLRRMYKEDFDLIAEHGYQTAAWNYLVFSDRRAG
jgi:NTE family protein